MIMLLLPSIASRFLMLVPVWDSWWEVLCFTAQGRPGRSRALMP